MPYDHWPMIAGVGAGVGAGVAAAAAVGQMIVSATALGQQNAGQAYTDKEISAIKQDLKRMQQILHDYGLDNDNTVSSNEQVHRARDQARHIDTVDDLKTMQEALQVKVARFVQDKPRSQTQDKSWFTRTMEGRGRDFMGIK